MRERRRVVLILLFATLAAACGSSGKGSSSAERAAQPTRAMGSYPVGALTETFVDTLHPTAANGDAPGQPTRSLVTTIFYPAASEPSGDGRPPPAATGAPFPLIVFAHGFTATPRQYEALLRAWASAGYVVAAPAFPLSNGDAPGGPTQNDVVNQPGDVSVVITQMLAASRRSEGPLHGAVDANRVGVSGHSAGAVTSMGVALNTCCHDDRIGAAAIMSGAQGTFPNGSYSLADAPPVLFLHGDADEAIAYSAGKLAFTLSRPPKFFVTLVGGNHTGPFSGQQHRPAADVVVRTTIDFFDRYLKQSPDGVRRLLQDGNVSGVATVEGGER